jgi:hypothetical protein
MHLCGEVEKNKINRGSRSMDGHRTAYVLNVRQAPRLSQTAINKTSVPH